MEKRSGILWIGGDKRQIVAENRMYADGWNTAICLNESLVSAKGKRYEAWEKAFAENHILVFPLPMSKKGGYLNAPHPILVSEIVNRIQPNSLVLGGKLPEEIKDIFSKTGIRYVDYYNEEFQTRNALPTAEAAIGIALLESPRTLLDSRSLVVGYGKIGKILAQKLQCLGTRVTVGARKPLDLALANGFGYATLSIADGIPSHKLSGFDFVFNTVPVRLFGREEMRALSRETLYMELASFPYGLDLEVAKEYAFRTVIAESLPGKYSPISAGEILAETVVQILEKEEFSP